MEEPIITFGSESLILEMFPDTITKDKPEIITIPEPIPEDISVPIPEPIPEPTLPKKWCSIS